MGQYKDMDITHTDYIHGKNRLDQGKMDLIYCYSEKIWKLHVQTFTKTI